MNLQWLAKLAAWMVGVSPTNLALLEGAVPHFAKMVALLRKGQPTILKAEVWYGKAKPTLEKARPLLSEVIPLIDEAIPLVENAWAEVQEVLPAVEIFLDLLKKNNLAGRDGVREAVYAMQSAYPLGSRNDAETMASVSSILTPVVIKDIQAKLGLQPDGIYGPLTLEAVKAFQKSHNLVVDGWPGKVTRAFLK